MSFTWQISPHTPIKSGFRSKEKAEDSAVLTGMTLGKKGEAARKITKTFDRLGRGEIHALWQSLERDGWLIREVQDGAD